MSDVFLSYAREDRQRAQQVANALAERGISVFWDLRLRAGAEWRDSLRRELDEARVVAVIGIRC